MASPTIPELSDLLSLHGLQVIEEDGRKFLHCVFSLAERAENALLKEGEGILTHLRLGSNLFEVLPVPLPPPAPAPSAPSAEEEPVVVTKVHEIPVEHLVSPDAAA